MYKITYSKIAFASTVILILFFSTTTLKAQTLVQTDIELSVSETQPKSFLNLDLNTSNLDFHNDRDLEKSNVILFDITLNVDEEDELINSNVIDTIQFVQYYKQFHLFYKNIS